MRKKLLVINRDQFGYHIDTYYYCKYASNYFKITYIGFDAAKPILKVDGVGCIYVPRRGSVIVRYLRLLFAFLRECRKDYDVIFIKYFVGCSLLKLFNSEMRFIFDIRTGSVAKNLFVRKLSDFVLRIESRFFSHISVISKSLAIKLRLPEDKFHVLPLGAEPADVSPKQFDSLKLLYVGTFNGRRIEYTVEGFARFYAESKDTIDITYDIVGDGQPGEMKRLTGLVERKGLVDVIRLPGYIHHSKLKKYYQRCNVGVSYVPINDIYDCQPPTKTYEYILAGMPVVATQTKENAIVINENNGVLIKDSAYSFYEAIKKIMSNKEQYDSSAIKEVALRYSWQSIVDDNFIPYIFGVCKVGLLPGRLSVK